MLLDLITWHQLSIRVNLRDKDWILISFLGASPANISTHWEHSKVLYVNLSRAADRLLCRLCSCWYTTISGMIILAAGATLMLVLHLPRYSSIIFSVSVGLHLRVAFSCSVVRHYACICWVVHLLHISAPMIWIISTCQHAFVALMLSLIFQFLFHIWFLLRRQVRELLAYLQIFWGLWLGQVLRSCPSALLSDGILQAGIVAGSNISGTITANLNGIVSKALILLLLLWLLRLLLLLLLSCRLLLFEDTMMLITLWWHNLNVRCQIRWIQTCGHLVSSLLALLLRLLLLINSKDAVIIRRRFTRWRYLLCLRKGSLGYWVLLRVGINHVMLIK